MVLHIQLFSLVLGAALPTTGMGMCPGSGPVMESSLLHHSDWSRGKHMARFRPISLSLGFVHTNLEGRVIQSHLLRGAN